MSANKTKIINKMDNICRTCMKSSQPVRSLFDVDDDYIELHVKLYTCFPTFNFNDSDFPTTICADCIKMLQNAYKFRELCVTSTCTFIKQRKNKITITDRVDTIIILDDDEVSDIGTSTETFNEQEQLDSSITSNISGTIEMLPTRNHTLRENESINMSVECSTNEISENTSNININSENDEQQIDSSFTSNITGTVEMLPMKKHTLHENESNNMSVECSTNEISENTSNININSELDSSFTSNITGTIEMLPTRKHTLRQNNETNNMSVECSTNKSPENTSNIDMNSENEEQEYDSSTISNISGTIEMLPTTKDTLRENELNNMSVDCSTNESPENINTHFVNDENNENTNNKYVPSSNSEKSSAETETTSTKSSSTSTESSSTSTESNSTSTKSSSTSTESSSTSTESSSTSTESNSTSTESNSTSTESNSQSTIDEEQKQASVLTSSDLNVTPNIDSISANLYILNDCILLKHSQPENNSEFNEENQRTDVTNNTTETEDEKEGSRVHIINNEDDSSSDDSNLLKPLEDYTENNFIYSSLTYKENNVENMQEHEELEVAAYSSSSEEEEDNLTTTATTNNTPENNAELAVTDQEFHFHIESVVSLNEPSSTDEEKQLPALIPKPISKLINETQPLQRDVIDNFVNDNCTEVYDYNDYKNHIDHTYAMPYAFQSLGKPAKRTRRLSEPNLKLHRLQNIVAAIETVVKKASSENSEDPKNMDEHVKKKNTKELDESLLNEDILSFMDVQTINIKKKITDEPVKKKNESTINITKTFEDLKVTNEPIIDKNIPKETNKNILKETIDKNIPNETDTSKEIPKVPDETSLERSPRKTRKYYMNKNEPFKLSNEKVPTEKNPITDLITINRNRRKQSMPSEEEVPTKRPKIAPEMTETANTSTTNISTTMNLSEDRHVLETTYECDLCNTRLRSLPELDAHLASHVTLLNVKKKLTCEYCPKTFLSVTGYKTHKTRIHKNVLQDTPPAEQTYSHLCTVCDKVFPTRSSWLTHKKIHVFG